MTMGELLKAKFPVTPEMPDYLTRMYNPMNGKIIKKDEKQATCDKATIKEIVKERPHNAMCNHMYLVLMRIFGANCRGREVGEIAVFIMTFAFRNALEMIMPISIAPKYLYLGSTRMEIDGQEEYEDGQEECGEKANHEFIWPASFDDAGFLEVCSAVGMVCCDESDPRSSAGNASCEDSEWVREVFGDDTSTS